MILISLYLEPMGHITSEINTKQNPLGKLLDGVSPWMVSLYDLMVITDLIDLPPMLPHYIQRRIRASKQGLLRGNDELDFFGYYLSNGMYFDGVKDAQPEFIQLTTHTTGFDDYYFSEMGVRSKKAPKPCQKMPISLQRLLGSLATCECSGSVLAAMAILGLDGGSRENLMEGVHRVKRLFAKDGGVHNVTLLA